MREKKWKIYDFKKKRMFLLRFHYRFEIRQRHTRERWNSMVGLASGHKSHKRNLSGAHKRIDTFTAKAPRDLVNKNTEIYGHVIMTIIVSLVMNVGSSRFESVGHNSAHFMRSFESYYRKVLHSH